MTLPCLEINAPTVERAASIFLQLLFSYHRIDTNNTDASILSINSEQQGQIKVFDYSALGYGKRTWRIGGAARAIGPGPERQIMEEAVRQLVLKRNLWVTIDERRGMVSWDFGRLATPERSCWVKVTGSLMTLYFIWQEMTGFPLSPLQYTLLHSPHTSLLEDQGAVRNLDPELGKTWEKWPRDKPTNESLSSMTPNDPVQQFLFNNMFPSRQPSQLIDSTQEEWDELSEVVLCSLVYGCTPEALRRTEDIANLRAGADIVIGPGRGITFLQVFTSVNGPSLTRQIAGGRLRTPDELISRLQWEEPSPVYGGNTIQDSANDPQAAPFMKLLKAYLLGRGHPPALLEGEGSERMFPRQVDENDTTFRASLFLLAVSGTQLVPTDPDWQISLRFTNSPSVRGRVNIHTCTFSIEIKQDAQLIDILARESQTEFDKDFHAVLWASTDFNSL
ncbi:hypothetical protein AAF712_006047 [Marasmius tenuissimus]|uniref:Uncharacterized protein n=1 Tax=Marasmius tenuissimus TaxID=585030 RepID=A0ABR3A2P3_9AGAR